MRRGRIIPLLLFVAMSVSLTGCSFLETVGGLADGKPTSFADINDLESGKAYVWNNKDVENIQDDLKTVPTKDVFFTCITGDYNFKKDELNEVSEYPRSIWIDSSKDESIPTVTSKNVLLYVSDEGIPDSIVFERFADYGYTIGISNLEADGGDHYYLTYADVEEDDYKHYIDMKSDAKELSNFSSIAKLYLDKAGKIKVDKEHVSEGGTVLGLEKDKFYVCEFYTGTYYQDFKLQANIHSFGSMERFVGYQYEFLHSNCIAITIPEYLKSGYYFVNGVGLFRYVADTDAGTYNGKAYDGAIDWNDPIILYNEDGTVKYDPSNPDYEEEAENEKNEDGADAGDEDFELEPAPTEETTETEEP